MSTKSTHKSHHELSTEDREELPESAFAFPKQRKMPINDSEHVRNALARFDQVEDVSDDERDEAFSRIKKAADRFGMTVHEKSWHDLGKKPHTKNPSQHHARR